MVMPKGLFSFPRFCDLDKVAIIHNLTYDSANIDKKNLLNIRQVDLPTKKKKTLLLTVSHVKFWIVA
jgi:hypothetical protein